MQRKINLVYEHSCKWRCSFNSNKSVGMVFRPNMKAVLQDSFTLGNSEIQFASRAIHLGLPVGSIPGYVDDRILKGKRATCAMQSLVHSGNIQLSHLNFIGQLVSHLCCMV